MCACSRGEANVQARLLAAQCPPHVTAALVPISSSLRTAGGSLTPAAPCHVYPQVYTIQMHNPHQVNCEWGVKKPAVESPKLKDWDCFRVGGGGGGRVHGMAYLELL